MEKSIVLLRCDFIAVAPLFVDNIIAQINTFFKRITHSKTKWHCGGCLNKQAARYARRQASSTDRTQCNCFICYVVCLKGTKEKPEIKPFFSTIRFRFHLVEIWGFCALAQTVALRARANRLFSSSPIPRRRGKAKAFPFFVVEIWGFEPQTYTLRTYRATNCAISPYVGGNNRT